MKHADRVRWMDEIESSLTEAWSTPDTRGLEAIQGAVRSMRKFVPGWQLRHIALWMKAKKGGAVSARRRRYRQDVTDRINGYRPG